MEKTFKVANLAAIAGTSWMALLILWVIFYRGLHLIQVFPRGTIGRMLFSSTELVFAFPLLFFFIYLLLFNRKAETPIVPAYAAILAVVGAAWMAIVAVLHRLPGIWRSIAIQNDGLLVVLTQIIFTVPLLIFFIVFGTQQGGIKRGLALRLSAIAVAVALTWSLIVSASHLSISFRSWLVATGVSRLFIITEPLMASSLLFFLVTFYIELNSKQNRIY